MLGTFIQIGFLKTVGPHDNPVRTDSGITAIYGKEERGSRPEGDPVSQRGTTFYIQNFSPFPVCLILHAWVIAVCDIWVNKSFTMSKSCVHVFRGSLHHGFVGCSAQI